MKENNCNSSKKWLDYPTADKKEAYEALKYAESIIKFVKNEIK
ncbi:MAG: hypothetical protein ABIF17_01230 [Patescibacteria group bacterium]